jgi:peptidoglycan hydrolase-like protein with peptidoglycan-binding domain
MSIEIDTLLNDQSRPQLCCSFKANCWLADTYLTSEKKGNRCRRVDGTFGVDTGAAVSQFKVDNGLSPSDPVVGVGTMTTLDELNVRIQSIVDKKPSTDLADDHGA